MAFAQVILSKWRLPVSNFPLLFNGTTSTSDTKITVSNSTECEFLLLIEKNTCFLDGPSTLGISIPEMRSNEYHSLAPRSGRTLYANPSKVYIFWKLKNCRLRRYIYQCNIIYLSCGERYEDINDHCSCTHNCTLHRYRTGHWIRPPSEFFQSFISQLLKLCV